MSRDCLEYLYPSVGLEEGTYFDNTFPNSNSVALFTRACALWCLWTAIKLKHRCCFSRPKITPFPRL